MNPAEVINFMIATVIIFLMIVLTWMIFKRKRTIALSISSLLIIGLTAGYFYYPTYKEQTHAKRYSKLMTFLEETYPEGNFSVRPEVYEEGVTVGRFDVAHTDTMYLGVTMQVDHDGQVSQTSTWTDGSTPEQEELWRELLFFHGSEYTLDKELPELKKVDQYFNGELTVFAVDINDTPAIAVYEYDQGNYGLLAFAEGIKDEYVQIEFEGQLFIYVNEAFKESKIDLLNSSELLNISNQKGKLIVVR
ncbi:hypothetical protein [Jeotgalibacillus malaysiensis]|uniref:hypothetical protein n=1 Tax=Jeotgalibacillus malaysiensis TaxID=1508404 RepID=UPI00384E8D65